MEVVGGDSSVARPADFIIRQIRTARCARFVLGKDEHAQLEAMTRRSPFVPWPRILGLSVRALSRDVKFHEALFSIGQNE